MFLILTVLYNKTISASETLHGIIESAGLLNGIGSKLMLWDNSTQRIADEEFDKLKTTLLNFQYQHTPQNLALSEIYNKTVEQGLNEAKFKYLILLDDDSGINKNYFKKVTEGAKGDFPLMIPVVKSLGIIRSPMRSYIIKASAFSKIKHGIFASRNITAINSGMVISFEFLRSTNFKYDTRLYNYGTDSYFMKFYNSKCKTIYILDYTFEHSLSFFDNSDVKRKLEIFRQTKKSYLIVHSDNLFNLVMAATYNFLSSLKNAWKFKTLRFFK